MSYKILLTKEFESDFYKLDKTTQLRISKKIEEVADNPARYKHLQYPLAGYCRIRIGKLRILFSYDPEKKLIYLEKIIFGHKY